MIGLPWLIAFALRSAGWWLRSEIIWHKPNPMPESIRDRPTKSHEYLFLLAKSQRYHYDAEAIKENSVYGRRVSEGAARSDRKAASSSTWRNAGTAEENVERGRGETGVHYVAEKRNKRSVWTVPTSPMPEAHFATFPLKLIEPCILAGCPEGGLVLDPFSGAGTTALVCRELGRRFVGAELNSEYIEISRKRLGPQRMLIGSEVGEQVLDDQEKRT